MYKLTRCVKKHSVCEPMNRHHAFLMRYSVSCRSQELKSTGPAVVITSFIMEDSPLGNRKLF